MDNLETNAWVFDSLVGFLHGPVWNVPLQTFIEEKSLSFEPTDDGGVPERPEYKMIHNEYRNLVDVMLGSFMEDIGITAEQFEAACHLSANDLTGLPAYFHKRLFEQIWAANDYEVFVKMMTHKNVELQLQALELIEKRYGAMPSLYSSGPEEVQTAQSEVSADWPSDDEVMTEIKKMQRQECITTDEPEMKVGPEEFVEEKQALMSKLQFVDKQNTEDAHKSSENEEQKSYQHQKGASKVAVTDEEIKARQEYLKQQRDKLLALKKQVRVKQLGAASKEDVDSADGITAPRFIPRPKSSHAAKAALKGDAPSPPPDAMQLRRALASKLKAEVVDIS